MKKLLCAVCIAAMCAAVGCAPAASGSSLPPQTSSVPSASEPSPTPSPTPTPVPERWGIPLKSESAGLELQVPAEWEVAGREELLTMAGLDASAGEEELAGVPMRYEVLARDNQAGGSVMVCLLNPEAGSAAISTNEEAAALWQQWMEAESPDYVFSDTVPVSLAGHDAVMLPARLGQATRMDNYLWLQNGRVVCVNLSYPDAQASVLARVLNSITALE